MEYEIKIQSLVVIDTFINRFTSPKLQSMNSFELGKKKDKGKLCTFHCSLQQPGFLIAENTHQVLATRCRQCI